MLLIFNFLIMVKYKKVYISILIAALAIGGYFYWSSKKKASQSQVEYVTDTAKKGTLTTAVTASGNVIVDSQSNIDPTISGTVADLAVKVGDQVTAGQFLFNVVNDQLSVNVSKSKSSVTQAQGSLESAEQQKKQAKADYDAAKKKDKTTPDTYTSEQLKAMKDKVDVAEASITTAEQNLISAQADLQNQWETAAKRKVTAPIDGTVNAVNIKNGDDLSKLSSGSSRQVPIIIGDLGTLKSSVAVNEVDISKVSMGQKAMLKFDSLDGMTLSGKVEKIDSLGTSTQGVVSYSVTIGFDTLDEKVKPQMSVAASIINDVKQNILLVPNSAVKSNGNVNYVEVLNSGTTPEQVNVQIGATNSTETEIISGLKEGDKVVTQTINPNATSGSSSSSRNSSGSGVRVPGLGGGGLH